MTARRRAESNRVLTIQNLVSDMEGESGRDNSLELSEEIDSHEAERASLAADVEAYLAQGGQIQEVPPGLSGEPVDNSQQGMQAS